jgi:DNA polymerase III alpha subunit (gram-positive type)
MENELEFYERMFPIKDAKDHILIIDLETTGLNYMVDEIVEIGICKLNIKTGKISILIDSLIKSNPTSDSWIIQNSTHSIEKCNSAPEFESFKTYIQYLVANYRIAAFNKTFDFSFLKQMGIKIPEKNKLPCLMWIMREICNIKDKRGRIQPPSFEDVYRYFNPNSTYIESHRAIDDTMHEAQIAFRMIQKHILKIDDKFAIKKQKTLLNL